MRAKKTRIEICRRTKYFFINIHDNCDDDDRFNYYYDDDLSVDAKKWAGCWAASGLSGGLQLKLH